MGSKTTSANKTIRSHMQQPQSIAGIILSPQKNAVLLIQRRDVPVWVLPGGGIEQDESPIDAIMREILEETGFRVKVDRFVGDYLPINRLAKRTYLYECSIESGEATLSSETKGVCFFSLEHLPPLPPPYPDWIEDTLKQLPPLQKKLNSVNYYNLFKNMILHPILVFRFLLARIGFPFNT